MADKVEQAFILYNKAKQGNEEVVEQMEHVIASMTETERRSLQDIVAFQEMELSR
jgi:signal recognition particle GTPase